MYKDFKALNIYFRKSLLSGCKKRKKNLASYNKSYKTDTNTEISKINY